MLSKKAKYAIKALEYIGKQDQSRPILISEVSEAQNIPKKFLEVILLEMKREGILRSKIGKTGGYNLLKKPKEIILGHVIRLIDGPIALVPCVSHKFYRACDECHDEDTCGLKSVMAQLRKVDEQVLGKITLAEVIRREQGLMQKKKVKKKVKPTKPGT